MLLYTDIMRILGLESIKQNNLQYILNKNLKNNYRCVYGGKQIVRVDDTQIILSDSDDKSEIEFKGDADSQCKKNAKETMK